MITVPSVPKATPKADAPTPPAQVYLAMAAATMHQQGRLFAKEEPANAND